MTGLSQKATSRNTQGFALMFVMIISAISFLAIASLLRYSTNQAQLTSKNNDFQKGSSAAEGAVMKVVGTIAKDYQLLGESAVYSKLATYQTLLPSKSDGEYWDNFSFSDASGVANRLTVERTTTWAYTNLDTKYRGFSGYNSSYRVTVTALDKTTGSASAVSQTIQLASIPIFQYFIFYNQDLEVCPDPTMTVSNRIHSNCNIYFQPDGNLTLGGDVTAVKDIFHDKHPDDPVDTRTPGTITYKAERDSSVNTLNLPIGTNANSAILREIVEVPPIGEATNSLLAIQRFYNKADMIITVTDTNVVTKSGSYNNFAITVTTAAISPVLKTNLTFWDMRESKYVQLVELDISKLNTQYATLTTQLGRNPVSIYVLDRRTQGANTMPGVRLINGQTMPTKGLVVATPAPLYIQGHFNAPTTGSTNTVSAKPVAVIADAVTVLSTGWNDSTSDNDISSRRGASTTVNAAIIAGNVPTGGGYYSGGWENLVRLLENWKSRTLTINGSFVCLYPSKFATGPWSGVPGICDYPTRKYNLDQNFANPSKLPQGTPELRAIFRSKMTPVAPKVPKQTG